MRPIQRWLVALGLGTLLLLFAATAAAEGKRKLHGKVNINTATAEQLTMLPGIGPATARNILDARKEQPFGQPWELTRAKGIGAKTFRKLEPHLSVEGETTLRIEEAEKKKVGRKRPVKSRSSASRRWGPPRRGPRIIEFKRPAPPPRPTPPRQPVRPAPSQSEPPSAPAP